MPLRPTKLTLFLVVLALLAAAAAVMANYRSARAQQRERAEALTGGDAARGAALFAARGCGGCHTLKGTPQATGMVGPPLDGVAERAVIAGVLENTPDNMVRWIRDPQAVVPGNAMPNLAIWQRDAQDIAAFLYSDG